MSVLDRLALAGHDVAALARAGVLGPMRPDHAIGTAIAVERWGPLAGAAQAAGARHANRIGLVDDDGPLTYREIHERGDALARAWAADGLGADDGIAIMCRNHRGMIDATIAASRLGARALYLNTGFSARQLAEVTERERASALVYDDEFAELVSGAKADHRYRADALDDDIARSGPSLSPPAETGTIVMLTSGTTGTPKGAPRRAPRSLNAAAALLSKIPFRTKQRTLVAAPLFHATGFGGFFAQLALASTAYLHRRFDPEQALDTLERERCEGLVVVPVMLQRMLDAGAAERDLSALRAILCAGSALPGDLAIRVMDAFGDVLYNLYGSTEVAQATIATPAEMRRHPGTAGRPPRGTIVKLLDPEGREVPHGETGRIFVGSALTFEGYTDGRSKEVVGGLMSTGDVGHLGPGGLLFVDGRDDEMIVSGAENVFPQEVEDVLTEHPAIAEAACVGVPDDEFGQRLKAFVVLCDGGEATEDDLKRHVRDNLARYKVPREFVFLDELPRNPTGKILKGELA